MSLALAAAIAAVYWQPIARRLRPAEPEKLTLAVINTYIGSGLVLIAAARGYFAAEGVEVTLQPHSDGRTAMEAVRAGHVTTVGNMPFMFAVLNRAPVVVLGSIASSFQGAGIVARRDRGVAAAADLKRKTIGVTAGTDGHYVHLALEKSSFAGDINSMASAGCAPSRSIICLTRSRARRHAENALGESQAQLAAILESTAEDVHIVLTER